MTCEKCKSEIADNLKFCNKCGAKVVVKSSVETQNIQTSQESANSSNANTSTSDITKTFIDPTPQITRTTDSVPKTDVTVSRKSRVTAGLLGIFLGGFGVHNFYLGFHVKAIIQILLSVFCCGVGSIWGFIEGILILANKINVDSTGASLK